MDSGLHLRAHPVLGMGGGQGRFKPFSVAQVGNIVIFTDWEPEAQKDLVAQGHLRC